MRKLLYLSLFAAAATLALFWPERGSRQAHAIGDLPPVGKPTPPDILLLYDSSANQNSQTGIANPTGGGGNNHLGGYSGAVKKYFSFQLVLTGEFIDTTKDHYTTGKPGLLDRYLDDARFGFAGIDTVKGTGPTKPDEYSYGETFDSTYQYEWDGTQITSKAVPANAVNQGIRNATNTPSGDFPFIKLYRSADKRTDNAAIQTELMSTAFSSNRDGLQDAFRDAHYFFTKEYPGLAGGNACGQGKYVIYLAAGAPGKDFSDGLEWVEKLRQAGVTTYVVGLVGKGVADEEEMVSYGDAAAKKGGGICADDARAYGPGYGHCAYFAYAGACDGKDPDCDMAGSADLAEKLNTVMSLIMDQVTSRSRLATSDAPLLSSVDGQWRVSAHFQNNPNGGAWRGFLRGTQVDGAGKKIATVDFDGLLDQRDPATRTIYTRNNDGKLDKLGDVLTTEYTSFVAAKRAFFAPTKPCIAESFFDSAAEWYRMLSGGQADSLSGLSCLTHASELALVKQFQAHKLGDIYHSSPEVVGPPSLFLSDPAYQTFLQAKQSRPTMVYAGANDGMLHAFYLRHSDPTKVGQEAWAYVPRALIERLPERILAHSFLLDGPLVVRDVQLPRSSATATDWRTVLVAGLGRGGGLYFALDVTDPEKPQPLWELSDPLLAYAIGAPAVGRVFVDGVERQVAFVSGGVDQSAPADDPRGKAFLAVDLFSGAILRSFVPKDADVTGPFDAALSGNPTAFTDMPTTFTTRVFVGDFKGRLWRIDTGSANTLEWKMTLLWPKPADVDSWDASPYARPVFLAPSAALNPALQVVLYYGTGDVQNLDTFEPNYLWGIREEFTISGDKAVASGETISDKFPVAFGDKEKLLGEPVVFNGVVLFTSFVASETACGFGEGRLYAIDYLTGEPRMGKTGALALAGDKTAQPFFSLGAGVPSTPTIRQQPASLTFNAHGDVTVSGGHYTALVHSGAAARTDQLTDTTKEVNLGRLQRRADVMSVVELD